MRDIDNLFGYGKKLFLLVPKINTTYKGKYELMVFDFSFGWNMIARVNTQKEAKEFLRLLKLNHKYPFN